MQKTVRKTARGEGIEVIKPTYPEARSMLNDLIFQLRDTPMMVTAFFLKIKPEAVEPLIESLCMLDNALEFYDSADTLREWLDKLDRATK